MIYAGKNIQSSADALQKLTIETLYEHIRSPKPEIEALIKRLRLIRGIDYKQYSAAKRNLPYIVCGCFNPPFRRTDNFAYIEYFIVDVDHITMKGIDMEDLKRRLRSDSRVMLMFVSPSQDGLKILFRLKHRCYDSGLYTIFYKSFVKKLSEQYGLEQVVDGNTCDVARACFISIDREAYYNQSADVVDMDIYVSVDDSLSLFDMKKEVSKEIKSNKEIEEETPQKHDPDKIAMDHILETLAIKRKNVEEKRKAYVPMILDEMIGGLKQFVEDQGIVVEEILDIQYAKKLRCKLGARKAEVNLFYGKRGFNVVQSPRVGTSEELNKVVAEIINIYIEDNYR